MPSYEDYVRIALEDRTQEYIDHALRCMRREEEKQERLRRKMLSEIESALAPAVPPPPPPPPPAIPPAARPPNVNTPKRSGSGPKPSGAVRAAVLKILAERKRQRRK
jgi:hypothetical protein